MVLFTENERAKVLRKRISDIDAEILKAKATVQQLVQEVQQLVQERDRLVILWGFEVSPERLGGHG